MKQARVVTSRRAYEYKPDDLRLSVLSLPGTQEKVQQLFGFQVAQLGTPMPTFGPVPSTIPPGIVFDYGVASMEDEDILIRYLHFEPLRLVIDTAGPSRVVDFVYEHLHDLLSETVDNAEFPAIGSPARVLDYTEISVQLDFDFEQLLNDPVRKVAQDFFGADGKQVFPGNINFLAVDPEEELQQQSPMGPALQIRAGTRLRDRVFYSAADLPSEQHLAWLEALEAELAP